MSCLSDVVVPPVNGTVADVEASDKALWDKVWIGFGIFLGLLGSVLINLGNNLQALAMQGNKDFPEVLGRYGNKNVGSQYQAKIKAHEEAVAARAARGGLRGISARQ